MALGNSQLNNFEFDRMEISHIIDGTMRNSWNTFNYVAKNLAAWADETTVGTELREDLIATADRLDTAMIKTKEFITKLDGFASIQREINNGRW